MDSSRLGWGRVLGVESEGKIRMVKGCGYVGVGCRVGMWSRLEL